MAKPAAKLIKEKNEKKEKQMYFQTTSLGRAFSDARILAHESVFDEMVEYTQLLKDFQDTYEKEDEKKLQEMIDRLAKLPDFLAMKDEEGQSVYDTVTQEMKPQQKWLFERNLTEACAKLDIYLDMEKITGKPKTIEVDGVVYTKQAFREKMYKNNWLEGADDLAIDRIFEGYYASMNDAKNMFKRLVPKMKKILDTPVPQDRQNGYKYENINSIMGDTTGSSIYKDQLNDVCVMYTAKAKKETHEVDKAAYLKDAAKKGWDHAGDEAFLSAATNCVLKTAFIKRRSTGRLICWLRM
ncbi:MAG: hypothetical protein IJ600_08250 [Lachnospiraceae bacterium]|nr:hypothetical protein [Lachnospiraceae bacterium]